MAAHMTYNRKAVVNMIGSDFSFGGHNLSDYGFVMANPDKEDSTGLNRDVLKGTTTIYKYEAIHYGSKYNDVLTIPFFIIKDDCTSESVKISQTELRQINSWLTFSNRPELLTVSFDTSNPINFYGIFTEITPYVIDGLNGLYITFTCTSPFATGNYHHSFTLSNEYSNYKEMVFPGLSDENTYIYPVIRLNSSTSCVCKISRLNSTGKSALDEMEFTLEPGKDYLIDCSLKRITIDGKACAMADVGLDDVDIVDYNNVATGTVKLHWLRLERGNNLFKFEFIEPEDNTKTINIEFMYRYPIKVGGYPYD